MARVRTPGVEQKVRQPSGQPTSPTLEQGLVAAGLAKNPQDARKLVRDLLAALHKAGFETGKQPTLEARLSAELGAFQKANGLPVTGRLDAATVQQLRQMGFLPGAPSGSDAAPSAPPPAVSAKPAEGGGNPKLEQKARGWLDFASQRPSIGPSTAGTLLSGGAHETASSAKTPLWQHMQTRNPAANQPQSADQMTQLPALLRFLTSLGFVGTGSGRGQLKSALRQFQASLGLPPSGRLDAETLRHLSSRSENFDTPSNPTATRSSLSASPDGKQEAVSSVLRGGEGAAEPKHAAGSGGAMGAGAGLEKSDGSYLSLGARDPRGDIEDDANAPAGDEDREDRRRGHAMLDEQAESEEGHYEIPSLSVQIFNALEEIQREEGQRGAATYSWDVTFYRPGIYGRRQPAAALWHIGVQGASPFDAVWREAQEALARKLAESEPQTQALTWEQMQGALRRARVRVQQRHEEL